MPIPCAPRAKNALRLPRSDRAAFHFLTEAADQDAYLRVMDRALMPAATASQRPG